jgi:hypothetical protein
VPLLSLYGRPAQIHELALNQSIVDLVVEYARREGTSAVTRVTVEIGAADVEPDALQLCFECVTGDTMAREPSSPSKRSRCGRAAATVRGSSRRRVLAVSARRRHRAGVAARARASRQVLRRRVIGKDR